MGVLSILNSDPAAFESDIMTRRRSKKFHMTEFQQSSGLMSKVSLIMSYKAGTKEFVPDK